MVTGLNDKLRYLDKGYELWTHHNKFCSLSLEHYTQKSQMLRVLLQNVLHEVTPFIKSYHIWHGVSTESYVHTYIGQVDVHFVAFLCSAKATRFSNPEIFPLMMLVLLHSAMYVHTCGNI